MLSKSIRLGIKLASKQTYNISEISNLTKNIRFPNKLLPNIESNFINLDYVVLDSKIGKKYIFSLKNQEGKLIQRYETGFGQNYINKSSDYLTQMQYSDGNVLNLCSKSSNISDIPKHHRTLTSFWDESGILRDYKETDVLLYRGKKGNNGLKITYKKTMPETSFGTFNNTDINEVTTIEGILLNKGIFYKRRSTFNTKTGEINNWEGFSKGLTSDNTKWLDSDVWLHARVQSSPEGITNSVLYQKGCSNVSLSTADIPSGSGGYSLNNGLPHITVSKNATPIDAFSTAVHEGEHLLDDKQVIEYLSTLLKGKTEKEVLEYASKNTDNIAYIFKKYLAGDYGNPNEIRRIAYEKICKFNEDEIAKIINANKNYVNSKTNYKAYWENYLELKARNAEQIELNRKNFYTDDYKRIFTPDQAQSGKFKFVAIS